MGRDTATLLRFFGDLGPERSTALTHVSADDAEWIHNAVTERAPRALICLDAFHVVSWATRALDEVRRGMWNKLRWQGRHGQASNLRGTRWALLKNIQDLTGEQNSSARSRGSSTNSGAPSPDARRLTRVPCGQLDDTPRLRRGTGPAEADFGRRIHERRELRFPNFVDMRTIRRGAELSDCLWRRRPPSASQV